MDADASEPASAESRSAVDYTAALNTVLNIVDGAAIVFAEGGGKVALALGVFKKIAPLIREAAPLVVPVVAPAVDRAKDVAARTAAKAPDALKETAHAAQDAAVSARDAIAAPIVSANEKREQLRARTHARKTLLDGATKAFSSKAFIEMWDAQEESHAKGIDSLLAYPGCYVILTFEKKVRGSDYSGFRDIYVGQANKVGTGIYNDFTGDGSPDVYADIKFKQPVYVLLYLCPEERLDELRSSLIVALDADDSYNRAE